jgi:hypothetical protein
MSDHERERRDRQGASFTIREWCSYRRVSPATFYVLDQKGIAPRSHYVGVKRLISAEADAEWLAAREAENKETAA